MLQFNSDLITFFVIQILSFDEFLKIVPVHLRGSKFILTYDYEALIVLTNDVYVVERYGARIVFERSIRGSSSGNSRCSKIMTNSCS